MVMTQQYLVGELSVLLAQLENLAAKQRPVQDVVRLRREVETMPLSAMPSITARTLALTDVLCWDAVTRGDVTTFSREAAFSAELYEFGVCAGLIEQA